MIIHFSIYDPTSLDVRSYISPHMTVCYIFDHYSPLKLLILMTAHAVLGVKMTTLDPIVLQFKNLLLAAGSDIYDLGSASCYKA